MKQLSTYIKEKLIINKNYIEAKIVVKSFDELRQIIEYRYDKLGPGTEQDPIDFNDVDVSNINSFCGKYNTGLFDDMDFKHIDISEWDVSNVTNMSCMFYGCKKLESVGDISSWDVSNVTDMSFMFYDCKELKSVGDISDWNVSNVRNKDIMFLYCPIKDEYKPEFK